MATRFPVPGGWHGGWSFFRASLRRSAPTANRAHATTLTGLGERRHLLRADVNLDTHVEDVCSCWRWRTGAR